MRLRRARFGFVVHKAAPAGEGTSEAGSDVWVSVDGATFDVVVIDAVASDVLVFADAPDDSAFEGSVLDE